jgi:amino acid transporter
MSALRKSIGPLQLIAMGAAGIIGTSWIYTNGEFFAAYGAGGEIFGLAIATVLASFIAMSYAELASKLPRADGEIVYGYVAFNRTVSFVGGWFLIGAYVSSLAFYVTASGTLLSQLFSYSRSCPAPTSLWCGRPSTSSCLCGSCSVHSSTRSRPRSKTSKPSGHCSATSTRRSKPSRPASTLRPPIGHRRQSHGESYDHSPPMTRSCVVAP